MSRHSAQVVLHGYYYTSSEIGGAGFDIVATPKEFDSSTLRESVYQLAQYSAPLDSPHDFKPGEVSDAFPVSYRAGLNEQQVPYLVRSRYVGSEYLKDGFSNRPGNYFSHVCFASEMSAGPIATLLMVPWCDGLTTRQQQASDVLQLETVRIDAPVLPLVEINNCDKQLLAGLLSRLAGGRSVYLAKYHWKDALDCFARIEPRLGERMSRRVHWSTYESNAHGGYDVFASSGETTLTSSRPIVFQPDDDSLDDVFHWASTQLANAKSFDSISQFWDLIDCLGGYRDVNTDAAGQPLQIALEVSHDLLKNSSADRYDILWPVLSQLEPDDARLALIRHAVNTCCQIGDARDVQQLDLLLHRWRDIHAWSGKSPDIGALAESAERLYLQPALRDQDVRMLLKARLSQPDLSTEWLREALITGFGSIKRRLDSQASSNLSSTEGLYAMCVLLGQSATRLWSTLLVAYSHKAAEGDESVIDRLANHLQSAEQNDSSVISAISLACSAVCTANEVDHESGQLTNFFYPCALALRSRYGEDAKSWARITNELQDAKVPESTIENILFQYVVTLESKVAGRWLDDLEKSINKKLQRTVMSLLHSVVLYAASNAQQPDSWYIDAMSKLSTFGVTLPISVLKWADASLSRNTSDRQALKSAQLLISICGKNPSGKSLETIPNSCCLLILDSGFTEKGIKADPVATMLVLREVADTQPYAQAAQYTFDMLAQTMALTDWVRQCMLLWRDDVWSSIHKVFARCLKDLLKEQEDQLPQATLVLLEDQKHETYASARIVIEEALDIISRHVSKFSDSDWEVFADAASALSDAALNEFFVSVEQRRYRRPGKILKSLFGRLRREKV